MNSASISEHSVHMDGSSSFARPPSINTAGIRPAVSTTNTSALTTFPNPFADEPEPGLIPSLLSKVKSTFAGATSSVTAVTLATRANDETDKGGEGVTGNGHGVGVGSGSGGMGNGSSTSAQGGLRSIPEGEDSTPPQTEAQLLAAAVKERHLTLKQQSQTGGNAGIITPSIISTGADSAFSARVTPLSLSQSPQKGSAGNRSLRPPPSARSSQTGSSKAPSIAPSATPSHTGSRRLVPPAERHWRPAGVAPAQVTISPVTSVTTTITGTANAEAGPSKAALGHRAHFAPSASLTQVAYPTTKARVPSPQLRRHAHRDSLSSFRPRRSSFATIPDSPSSVSLSAMLHNAELSQNVSYVPGFPLGQDDTRSVKSLALVKKSNSVSKIIRRMRGEGLSKHYWMLDEHCKECYDCKSVFTAWRRKHHCRICGQIFCSRCASNIIGARRFGQEGAVRVCNLCLKIMEEYRDDDEADRRSINSVATSARLPLSSDRAIMDAAISPDLPYSKSPFAASQLFSSNPDDTLGAIEEGVQTRWGSGADTDARPYSPADSDDDSIYDRRPTTAIPFRRAMDDDGKVPESAPSREDSEDGSPDPDHQPLESPKTDDKPDPASRRPRLAARPSEKRRRVEFPRTETVSSDGVEPRAPLTRVDSNQPLVGLRTRLSSRASQGGLTSLIDAEKSEGLWRTRSNSFVKRPELIAGASLHHFHCMLEQAIARASLPSPQEWHRVLSDILLKVSTHVNPNVRAGDSIDVRAYVKIKKVPGGKIADSEYVDGIVISKNVAHKAMPRRLVNPRIMVVTFPLDYHRVENQFMSLDPIMAQEKDYLRLLTRRIIDVRPHIVLVERSASRLALDHLLEAGIAVARSVKLSAIHQVARCTQADVVGSMDRLALEPRLGRCAEFRIQSFDHELIPGRRKTLMRFEGCLREYGCTIILRGGDIATLRKVKHIADFMSLVVYQLKNEIILYNDEHNILPIRPPLRTEYEQLLAKLAEKDVAVNNLFESTMTVTSASLESTPTTMLDTHMVLEDERAIERRDAKRLTRDITVSLEPYLTTILSSSVAIRLSPPAPLAKMAELDITLRSLRRQRDEDETREILQEERKEPSRSNTIETDRESIHEQATASSVSEASLLSVPSANPPFAASPTRVKDPYRVLRKPDEISRDSTIAQTEHAHNQQIKLWQWYNRRHPGPLNPEDYQNLIYLFSLGCEGAEKPCVEPTLQHIDFYQPGDATLGQFLETLALDAAKPCPNKACERLLIMHFRLLVHGDRRLQIAIDQFPCPSPGHEDRIITWSYCRICATPSPTTIMREETWKMSWGAYLEHCFYPPETPAGFSCSHDAYRDQIRYFAHRNLAIRIHNEPIELYDPVRPSILLQCKAETKVILKNQEYEVALQKNAAFFDSVLFRLRSFDYEICHPEKVGELRSALEAMLSRAVADREELVNLLNRTYKLTPMTDVLALNTVLRTLQDKVVQWDTDFADIEKVYLPSEKDLRRMTASHLKRLFATDGVAALDRSVAGLTVSEADEKELKIDSDVTPATSELSTPIEGPSETSSTQSSSSNLVAGYSPDDGTTPLATVAERHRNPVSGPPTPDDDGDSDTTIGQKDVTRPRPTLMPESSEMDSDAYFVSRIPRRAKPAASIADLVKRFQDSSRFETPEDVPLERPRSSGSVKRTYRHHEPEMSDSDTAFKARPRLRRGKTEQPPSARQRDPSARAGMTSDGDRSYAHNASRAPHTALRRNPTVRGDSRPTLQHRTSGLSATSASPSRSGRNSPEALPATASRPGMVRNNSKSRLPGKGKAPRSGESAKPGPSVPRPGNRRALTATPSNRVTSIARHFDRLSRDAERERQKRNAVMRNKRARPVAATKVKVQVFNNVRDAFRDESESDSSEADNEEDDAGSDDDADSDGVVDKARSPSGSPKKSPKKAITVVEPEATPPIPVASIPSESDISMPISASGGSIASSSIVSDVRSEMSFTDRLKIDLPTFETSAPLPSVPATPQMMTDTADESLAPPQSQLSHMSESELSSGGERSSILKTLTGLWAFRAGDYTPLDYPLSAADHIFADSKVIIRENEPTSIIAFTLSSKTYRDKMKGAVYASSIHGSVRNEAFMPDDGASIGDRSSTWDIVSLDEAVDAEDPWRREGATHLKYDFDSGSSNIFCRIFFAEQFAALRSACQCEDSFVESLARCVQFDASGGKSGSAFLKTKDDRFICKEISRLEMDALTKFAPAYFEYTKKAFQGQRPTVLAKIYGFFKIGYRNAVTGRAMRMNVLVMENLFYERRFTKIYDLKGSTRNRLIQATGKVNEVLLDENLMEIVYKHPLYLREHSKRILRTALFNDTLFLSNLNVMDYSLVVGVDAEKRELVIGIVDYIRTFTWDKKLESWVKDSAFLGGAGKGEPTIVTPKQYKARFRAAMERFYFPSVPDRWSKLGADEGTMEEEGATMLS